MTLRIYYGMKEPLKAIGKNQCRMLDFAFRFPCWHTYSTDKATMRAINGLERRGAIVVDHEHKMFKIAINKAA